MICNHLVSCDHMEIPQEPQHHPSTVRLEDPPSYGRRPDEVDTCQGQLTRSREHLLGCARESGGNNPQFNLSGDSSSGRTLAGLDEAFHHLHDRE